ncbi:MAG: sigma 54-interacting transcriptional regulator [Fibrobacteres bacterium]|nr:sigma 54-interacting transcriptional regulator [Fibrobacterota bacterium]
MIGKISEPLENRFADNLFVQIDGKGFVTHFFGNNETLNVRFGIFLYENGHISNAFDVKDNCTMAECCPGNYAKIWAKTNIQQEFHSNEQFYTDLRILGIHIYKIDPNCFLGIVFFTRLLPNITYTNSNLIVFIDENELIRGFNRNFLNFFSFTYINNPNEIINKTLKDFLHPSPAEMEKAYLRKVNRQFDSFWHTVYNWPTENTLENLPLEDFSINADSSISWKNNHDSKASFISLPCPIDATVNDFNLEIHFKIISGDAPLILLTNQRTDNAPKHSEEGYQISPLVRHTGFGLKRNGNFVKKSLTLSDKPYETFNVQIIEHAIYFDVNGENVIKTYDPIFHLQKKVVLFLGLRARSNIVLSKICVRCRDNKGKLKLSKQEDIIVQLKSSPPKYFSLTRFYNFSLDSYQNLSAYILSDVTPLHEKIALYKKRYELQRTRLKNLLEQTDNSDNEMIIGEGYQMKSLKSLAITSAGSNVPILIQGETGTGKEIMARYIHSKSSRSNMPFVKVDCSALPENLIESELFGHEKGAFTGAIRQKTGRFVDAGGGTLFIDEISNIPIFIQAKLLGFLQDFTIVPIGGTRSISVDVRVIVASNVDLNILINKRLFREDLYYRISTIIINLPPLRNRKEDIPLLCKKFIDDYNLKNHKDITSITPAAYQKLFDHSWPGNIRELKNVIEKACVFCEGNEITPEVTKLINSWDPVKIPREKYHFTHMQKVDWEELLRKHHGNIRTLSKEIGISRNSCYENLRKYHLDQNDFRKHVE